MLKKTQGGYKCACGVVIKKEENKEKPICLYCLGISKANKDNTIFKEKKFDAVLNNYLNIYDKEIE